MHIMESCGPQTNSVCCVFHSYLVNYIRNIKTCENFSNAYNTNQVKVGIFEVRNLLQILMECSLKWNYRKVPQCSMTT
jgi:hypothetical protein